MAAGKGATNRLTVGVPQTTNRAHMMNLPAIISSPPGGMALRLTLPDDTCDGKSEPNHKKKKVQCCNHHARHEIASFPLPSVVCLAPYLVLVILTTQKRGGESTAT